MPEASSVGRARRAAVAFAAEIGRHDLADIAALVVSELVTNAVIHAGSQVRLQLTQLGGGLRIEVGDDSPILPALRLYDLEATTGRGLALVGALTDNWGIEPTSTGKLVWCELGGPEHTPAPSSGEGRDVPTGDHVVHLLGTPPGLVLAAIEHADALLRELMLLSMAGEAAPPATAGLSAWSPPRLDLSPLLALAGHAHQAGLASCDFSLSFRSDDAHAALARLALVDEADDLAAAGALLIAPALPEVAACRRWYLGQIADQVLEGRAAQAWEMGDVPGPVQIADLPPSLLVAVGSGTGMVVADAANHIVLTNGPAAQIFGWPVDELIGQRLTVIVPPELRQAHLAGYTRALITGQNRIMDRPVALEALRRDGTRTSVVLTISRGPIVRGRQVFVAVVSQGDAATGKTAEGAGGAPTPEPDEPH